MNNLQLHVVLRLQRVECCLKVTRVVEVMKTKRRSGHFFWIATVLFCGIVPVFGAGWKILPGHVPPVVSSLTAKGLLPATNQLNLAIGLPLRDAPGLDDFLAQLYDPASPNFRQFLTPEEFTARFGPTEQDYEAVKNFARTNGLAVTTTYSNRLVLDVAGPAAAVEKAFHITLRTYRHPTEARDFFAPDTEPMVDAALPVVDVQGMSDFSRPHPRLHRMNAERRKPSPKMVLLRTAPAAILATIFATPMCRARR